MKQIILNYIIGGIVMLLLILGFYFMSGKNDSKIELGNIVKELLTMNKQMNSIDSLTKDLDTKMKIFSDSLVSIKKNINAIEKIRSVNEVHYIKEKDSITAKLNAIVKEINNISSQIPEIQIK
jgi:hypothetical protein